MRKRKDDNPITYFVRLTNADWTNTQVKKIFDDASRLIILF